MGCSLCPASHVEFTEERRLKVRSADKSPYTQAKEKPAAVNLQGRSTFEKTSAKAKELAAAQIDRMVDASAPVEEQASRQRRLLKGPEEFREVRVDRANAKRPQAE
jgi:hypothetical protein